MKEYGGYIEFEYYHGREYHENALRLNSGRHCLEYWLRATKAKTLYLPYFLCNSVADTCKKVGVAVEYYSIDIQFRPIFTKTLGDGEWLYVVNFYGQLSDETLLHLKQAHKNILVDNAQAFFCQPLPGVDTLYTCRKFFGVTDGGYLYTDARLEADLEQDCSYDRMVFLFGRMEQGAGEFYSQYAANNHRLSGEPIKQMSKATQNLLKSYDYDRICTQRRANFARLHGHFQNHNKLTLSVPDGAFMYPLYVENGTAIRKELQTKRIFIPTLWPDVLALCDQTMPEYAMANNILPLPVDQRYTEADMDAIAAELLRLI